MTRTVHHREPEPETRRRRSPATRAARSRSRIGRRRPQTRRYRSREPDVASMNSTASAALASAENTAASASAPNAGVSVARHRREREVPARCPGWSACADMPISVGSAANSHQRHAVPRDAGRHRALVARAERLLQQARRDDERRAEEEQQPPSRLRRAAGEEIEPRRIGGDRVPAAGERQRHRRDEREADQLDGELHQVDVGGAEETAGDEVDADERRAEQRSP